MNRANSVSIGRIIAVAVPLRGATTGYRGPAPRSLPIDAFVEIAQDARGDAPDVSILIRHGIIMSGDALPVAAVALVVLRSHQEGERNLERLRHLRRVESESIARGDPRHRRQDAEPAEGQ